MKITRNENTYTFNFETLGDTDRYNALMAEMPAGSFGPDVKSHYALSHIHKADNTTQSVKSVAEAQRVDSNLNASTRLAQPWTCDVAALDSAAHALIRKHFPAA